MAYIKIIYVLFIVTIQLSFAKEPKNNLELKKIIAKQALYNIRFVSSDSSFTIYQKHTGGLFLSTNYSVKKIIDGEENSQYNIIGDRSMNNIIITRKSHFHQKFNPNRDHDIFLMPYGGDTVNSIGKGIAPNLHLTGNFISFFKPTKNIIKLKKLSLPTKSIEIPLPQPANPFFRPDVRMINENEAIIYQQNSSGIGIITIYDIKNKQEKIIFKAKDYQSRLEICLKSNDLFIFTSVYLQTKNATSKLIRFSMNNNKIETLYESKKFDLGMMACKIDKENIFFIKNYGQMKKNYFDVARFNIKNTSLDKVTNEDYITNIFEMDGRLIAVSNGIQMLLIGDNSLKKDSIPSLKK